MLLNIHRFYRAIRGLCQADVDTITRLGFIGTTFFDQRTPRSPRLGFSVVGFNLSINCPGNSNSARSRVARLSGLKRCYTILKDFRYDLPSWRAPSTRIPTFVMRTSAATKKGTRGGKSIYAAAPNKTGPKYTTPTIPTLPQSSNHKREDAAGIPKTAQINTTEYRTQSGVEPIRSRLARNPTSMDAQQRSNRTQHWLKKPWTNGV